MSNEPGRARPPQDPTSAVKPAQRAEPPPPPAPRELPGAPVLPREFECDGVVWLARLAGKGACGTGSYGLGLVEAIHFAIRETPDLPLREALLPRGRFEMLHDSELIELLAAATPIEQPKQR